MIPPNNNLIWLIVGILAIVALAIYIAGHVTFS